MEHTRCLIVGGGPAGYTAAIYASRANLSPILYEGLQPGGQLTTTTVVENFPGFPDGVDALTLMEGMKKQAANFGADIRTGVVTAAKLDRKPFLLTIDGKEEITADSIIIATGASAKYLGLESEKKYMGAGVSACATCDGFFYRKKTVAVVGGGDTACEEALYLSGLASKVYMIVRRDVFRASAVMQKRVLEKENIEVLWNCNTQEVLGDGFAVTGARLLRKDGTTFDIAIDGFFLGIGHKPGSEVFAPWIDTDAEGFIVTDGFSSRTSLDGVFAAGDVRDKAYKQAVTAAASGCMAAKDAENYLIANSL